ncbi:MAG: hypothetical protein B7Y99_08055 [Caulobacterales bacterium 32-69-10]|nr:MAG: hypothetical protein B7Y99_08055 [Caulobacterales bacterium 32-69-10]
MTKGRLEAFSDGVIAIIITIMVLELKIPHGTAWADLGPLIPTFLSYGLSFVVLGIYWTNHHHMIHVVKTVTGTILWANLHLLFWLSVVPFVTAWMGENHYAAIPVALYGFVLFMAGFAFTILAHLLVRHEGPDSTLAKAVGRNHKRKISQAGYALGIVAAFFMPAIGLAFYVAVALMWFVPDRRIEKQAEV